MAAPCDVTIVGAGPFGLSIAAHLRRYGVGFRIIGSSMHSWRTRMPKGMLLKSAGFASSLYDPEGIFTLDRFCSERGIPYHDLDIPVSLETFCSYGVSFQERFAPDLEDESVVALRPHREGFELQLGDGTSFKARKVVLAVGIDYFKYVPDQIAHLPVELLSHSSEHSDLRKFKGCDVIVLGSGASAIDTAVLLHEAQARVQLVARKSTIHFGGPWGGRRSLWNRVRAPVSRIGPGIRSKILADAPWFFRYLPEDVRLRTIKTHLGPSGGWFMMDRAAPVTIVLGHELQEATVADGRAQLRLVARDGTCRHVSADHIIAATGYNTDVRRLPILSSDLVERLQLWGQAPRLSAHFESSVPGLYFAGPIAAATFGPVMRFVAGADFTSRRVSRHLARSRRTI